MAVLSANEMRAIAGAIQKEFPGIGFCLMIFPFGGGDFKEGQWISNANRQDMIKAIREMADRIEKGETYSPPELN